MSEYRERVAGWYKSARWRQLRKAQLARHPWCECEHHRGQRVRAHIVDHKRPHRGDMARFFDPTNLQSMTKACHDSRKQSQEKGGAGFLAGCDERGIPLAASHHWNATA